jgi:DNA-directed RNA polymerase subunit F
MIIQRTPISLSEALKYASKEKNPELNDFAKKLKVLDLEKAEKLKEELVKLEILKLNEKHFAKIVEMVPKNKEDLNKIVPEANLDDEEQERVLNAIKGI